MKNLWMSIFTFSLLISTAALSFSCEKTEDEPGTSTISDEEALEIVSGATMTASEGLTAEAVEMAYVADAVLEKGPSPLACGETADSTFVREINLDRITGLYSNYLFWGLECNDLDLPNSIFFGREMAGNYETARLISADEAESDWDISSLLTGPNYIFNGQYERNGTQESKVRDMRNFSSNVLIEVEDLNIDKGEKEIVSGIAQFTLTGNVNGEVDYSVTGTIVFLGEGTANVIINGNTYTIEL